MRRLLYVLMGAALLTALPQFAIAYSDKPEAQVASLRPKISGTMRVPGDHLIAVTQLEPTQETIDSVKASLVKHPADLKYLNGTRNRLVSFELIDQDTKATQNVPTPDRYRAAFYDYTINLAFVARGRFDHSDIEVSESAEQPDPSEEEFQEAVAILSKDPKLGPSLQDKTTSAYQPMPPLINTGSKGDRVLGIGLFSRAGSIPHEVVGANLVRGTIMRFETQAPPTAIASPTVCGPPSAGQGSVPRGTAGQFLVQIIREGVAIWQFTVVRPSASSGTRGSSIELRDVDYRGKRVLRRARTPILNAEYERNACGPFRDWSYQEERLIANGTDAAPGIRVCNTPPTTIIDTGSDTGNFLGVDIYDNRSEVTLVTEKSAGWYCYLSEYTFQDNEVTCVSGCDTRIQIHNFINGESIVNQDLVVWYGVHFQHHSDDTNTMGGPHVIGPDLILEKY